MNDVTDHDADRLTRQLRTLAGDADRVPLADSADVRRRGNRRRRATQAGTVLGVAVLAVGVVGVAGTLNDRQRGALPVASSAASATPTAVSSPPAFVDLADNPFLRADDLAPIGPYVTFATVPGGGSPRLTCLSDPAAWGATVIRTQAYTSDLDATFVETVLLFPDVASARAAAVQPLAEFNACAAGDPAEAAVVDGDNALLVGDVGYRFSRLTTPTSDADLMYDEVAVARESNVVVVLDWSSMGRPGEGDSWAWGPGQLQVALDRAVS
jgi:hypothetical protein